MIGMFTVATPSWYRCHCQCGIVKARGNLLSKLGMALATGDSHSISSKSRGDAAAQRQIYSYLNTLIFYIVHRLPLYFSIFPTGLITFLTFKEPLIYSNRTPLLFNDNPSVWQ